MPEKIRRIPAFIRGTYEMLEREDNSDIVAWSDSGDGFVIKNLQAFSDEVLPQYFKHKKYTSFVRQLNMYGFHKKRHHANFHEFSHENFRRGALEPTNQNALIQTLKRKPEKKKKLTKSEGEASKNMDHNDHLISSDESHSVSIVLKNEEDNGSSQSESEIEKKQVEKGESQLSEENKDIGEDSRGNDVSQDYLRSIQMMLLQNELLRGVHANLRNELLQLKNLRINNSFSGQIRNDQQTIAQRIIDQLKRKNTETVSENA